jgi:hypothetical protein
MHCKYVGNFRIQFEWNDERDQGFTECFNIIISMPMSFIITNLKVKVIIIMIVMPLMMPLIIIIILIIGIIITTITITTIGVEANIKLFNTFFVAQIYLMINLCYIVLITKMRT